MKLTSITSRNLSRVGAVALMATLAFGVVGCKSTTDRTSGQKFSDRQIARNVESDLKDAPTFKYPDVKANVYNGSVQLTGFVETEEQRQRAAEVASHVKGVSQVINDIMIKPMPTGRATIRDPLGHETGKIMLETNAPAPAPLRMQPSQSQEQLQSQPSSGETERQQ